MENIFLYEKEVKNDLFPLTLTRQVADIRVGILTIKEKWTLSSLKKVNVVDDLSDIPSNATVVPSNTVPEFTDVIRYPWDIFRLNDSSIRVDFSLITKSRRSVLIPRSVQTINPENIFIEEGAQLSHCIINAQAGPVYIGKNAVIMEGSLLRGPIAILDHAIVKMGTRIYGATTVGPYSIVGGEIKNSVIFGYSNKAHDGYLGDSVVGEWCNLGAGTSNSNVKNNASEVRMWSDAEQKMKDTGLTKCGLIMGDYSRSAINTSFNTGTMVGVCANVFGDGDLPKYLPSFSWGRSGERYDLDKALNDIDKWKKLKGQSLTEKEKTTLKLIFGQ